MNLNNLKTINEYIQDRRNVFPSKPSIEWFIRKHKSHLLEAGALSMPTGRTLINSEIFDQAVLDIGQKAYEVNQ